MYAIIESGGKQYRIEEGKKVKLEKIEAPEGEEIRINNVLTINGENGTVVGHPFIDGAYVNGRVVAQGRLRKVTIFKHKRRKDYKVKKGHRQFYTELLIEKIIMEA
ncbi:MAG TPA: 50S ribosomal protein L21 [Syntrophorhabdaceae bacterium]|nr:50S ribosomal protein L21 [Syntrophorhabdaceae bacterium]